MSIGGWEVLQRRHHHARVAQPHHRRELPTHHRLLRLRERRRRQYVLRPARAPTAPPHLLQHEAHLVLDAARAAQQHVHLLIG